MSVPQVAVVGVDTSGAVTAELSEHRELISVVVSSGWEQLFPSGALGSRVFDAYSDGLSKLPQISYSDIAPSVDEEQDIHAKLREFDGPPRSVESYTEDAQNAMDRAIRLLVNLRTAAAAAHSMPGEAESVAFRLRDNWLAGCDVNARWAAGKSGGEITAKLAWALAEAKSDTRDQEALTGAQAQLQEAIDTLLSLGNEAIAALGYHKGKN
ncbi:hypothetical protein FZI91_20045 [Mycobacterium sp. CBMA271]|uniref:hypothetical protein n=1 Tax=unclassified Mycobacteroides TaxID=2618759 RepID=UPI0012DEAC5A|nr:MULTISPECIES: hypothetical protein [unclassified Mycobacteroides]MUM23979.1 hypothetical protein [Mycobacteroides sp. CBMA 271]